MRQIASDELDLPPEAIRETEVNEPLINWHSFDGDWALDAIRSSGGFAENASDKEMLRQARLLREKGEPVIHRAAGEDLRQRRGAPRARRPGEVRS